MWPGLTVGETAVMSAPKSYTPAQERRGDPFIKYGSKFNTWLYRRTGGRLGGSFVGGAAVCLLTTTGRRSGEPRTMPLLYLRDGDDIVVVASKGGYSTSPQWYFNLLADPSVEVTIGREHLEMTARVATAEEKSALWPRLVDTYKYYDTYQARTDRDIPVVICSPRTRGETGGVTSP